VKQGPAREVLQVGDQPTGEPGPGEVRVHLKTSGVNPSDWKSRSGRTAPMSAPLIIPHSDGAGDIDRVGPGSPIALASGFRSGRVGGCHDHLARARAKEHNISEQTRFVGNLPHSLRDGCNDLHSFNANIFKMRASKSAPACEGLARHRRIDPKLQ
jgi:D-arabinose 1-dehydrogenase-like Zn-dependent alcohol dehydrogenase